MWCAAENLRARDSLLVLILMLCVAVICTQIQPEIMQDMKSTEL